MAINISIDVVILCNEGFNFFQKATKNTTRKKIKQSNSSHAHISVLQRVLAKLEGLVSARTSWGAKMPAKYNCRINMTDFNNMIACLEVQVAANRTQKAVIERVEFETETTPTLSKKSSRKSAKKQRKPEKP